MEKLFLQDYLRLKAKCGTVFEKHEVANEKIL